MVKANLIASSNQEMPIVRINGILVEADEIAREMQYHPAESQREAIFLATQALVLQEVLKQRADEIDLQALPFDNESTDEARLRCLLEREVQVPAVTESELELYYRNNPRKFTTPPLLAARHILLAADPVDSEQRSERADMAKALLQQLQQGQAGFDELAREYSDCPSREQGGELGQISIGQTVPELEKQLLRLTVGLAGQPIESRYGYHVIDVRQRIEGQLLPFATVRDKISAELSQRSWHKSVAQYLQILVAQANIEGIVLQGAASPLLQ
ncbi:MAG: peptidylprolyl isomerase [Thiopseudomonas sp.]|nr:peptidylprolyl isomerase [Thiopseudomonas sp.]MCK9466434.1 peptidylprolyl isomerase [Thiopseudomonas sp.]